MINFITANEDKTVGFFVDSYRNTIEYIPELNQTLNIARGATIQAVSYSYADVPPTDKTV